MRVVRFLFVVGMLAPLLATAQPFRVEVANLRSQWKVFDATWVSAPANTPFKGIYFSVDAVTQRGSYIEIKGIAPFSVWCRGQLIGQYQKQATLSVDSLARIYTPVLQLAVFGNRGLSFAETRLVSFVSHPPVEKLTIRTKSFFLDFSIIATLTLWLYFVLLFQSNPRLVLDYFNFIKLFSVQERDENLVAGRVGSSINLVVYLFITLWFSFLLLIVFHHTLPHWVVANYFSFDTVGEGMGKWFLLWFYLVLALLAKITLTLATTQIFKFREAYVIQVFNFFRLMVFIAVIFSGILLIYFVSTIAEPVYFNRLILLLGWTISGWFVLSFFKLMSKSPFTAFHLFSYLCATEIFPLVIFYEALFF